MKKRKICLAITTRGNYAKMKSVVEEIEKDPSLELQTIVGGGAVLYRYGNIADSLLANQIKIDRTVHFVVEGETPVTMAKSAGLAVSEFCTAFESLRPDVVVVIADRFECLPIAMTASYMNIPVAHVEGGEVSGSIDESVRHAITKLSHVHFPATEEAGRRIQLMGEVPESIFPVGATSLDVIARLDLADLDPVMKAQEKAGVGEVVDLSQRYLLVIQHPVTTEYEANQRHVEETIQAIRSLNMNTIWIWPNMDAGSDGIAKGIRMFREKERSSNFHFFKSLPIELYAPLLANSSCIVGNSSSGVREAAFLGVPAVNIGTRQSGRERGSNVMDVDYDGPTIKEAIGRQLAHGPYAPDYLYGNGKAGVRIVEVLRNYQFQIQKRNIY